MKKILGIIVLSLLLSGNAYTDYNKKIKFLNIEINFLDHDTETDIKKITGKVEEYFYQNIIYIQSKDKKITKVLETFIFDNHGDFESRFRLIAKGIFYKSDPHVGCNNSEKNFLHKVTDNNQLYINCVAAKILSNENRIYDPNLKEGSSNNLRLDLRKKKIKSIIDENNLVVPSEIIRNEHYFYKAGKVIWIIFSEDKSSVFENSNSEKFYDYINNVKKIHQKFENKLRFKNFDKISFN